MRRRSAAPVLRDTLLTRCQTWYIPPPWPRLSTQRQPWLTELTIPRFATVWPIVATATAHATDIPMVTAFLMDTARTIAPTAVSVSALASSHIEDAAFAFNRTHKNKRAGQVHLASSFCIRSRVDNQVMLVNSATSSSVNLLSSLAPIWATIRAAAWDAR